MTSSARLTVEITVLDVTERGVQVMLDDDPAPFWLPRAGPGIEWSSRPEPGDIATVRLPGWLVAKHRQLATLQYQRALSLYAPGEGGMDPERSKGDFPMANDYPEDAGKGMLGRNSKAEKPTHPSHTGVCDIAGRRYRIAAWVKTNEKTGEKYFSLSFRDAGEQSTKPQPTQHGERLADDSIPF